MDGTVWESVQKLKSYLRVPPLLAKLNPKYVLQLYLDYVVSLALVKSDGKEQCYTSKVFLDVEKRYSHTEKLIYAL